MKRKNSVCKKEIGGVRRPVQPAHVSDVLQEENRRDDRSSARALQKESRRGGGGVLHLAHRHPIREENKTGGEGGLYQQRENRGGVFPKKKCWEREREQKQN